MKFRPSIAAVLLLTGLMVWAASPSGFRVTGPVVPSDTDDEYPTHRAGYGQGGLHSVSNSAARDAIPALRREPGMLVWVQDEERCYRLAGDLTNWVQESDASATIRTASLADLLLVKTKGLPDGAYAETMERAVGAGGGLRWRLDKSSAATTNLGTIIQAADGGRWHEVNWNGDVRAFGFSTGASAADNQAALQAAADYATATNTPRGVVRIPAGEYMVRGPVRPKWATIEGVYSRVLPRGIGTVLRQPSDNPTNLLEYLVDDSWPGTASPVLRNLQLFGSMNQNQRDPVLITGTNAGSRLVFSVAPGDLPPVPASPAVWPHYGHCFFYTSENRYAGFGVVTNIDGGTGEVTLRDGYDLYATDSTKGNRLSPGWKVVWSPTVSEKASYLGTFSGKTATFVSPADAGGAAIWLGCNSTNRAISQALWENLYIANFHVGIRVGAWLFNQFRYVQTQGNAFAGIAGMGPYVARDDIYDHCFMQGYFLGGDLDQSAATISLSNSGYQYTGYGLYLPSSATEADQNVIDHCQFGLHIEEPVESRFVDTLIEGWGGDAVVLGGQSSAASRIELMFDRLLVRSPNSTTWLTNRVRTIIRGQTRSGLNPNGAHFQAITVTPFGPTGGYYSGVFGLDSASANILVDSIHGTDGASQLFYGSTAYPKIGAWRFQTTAAETRNGWYFDGTDLKAAVALVDRLSVRASNPHLDAIAQTLRIGTDTADLGARTDLAQKKWVIGGFNYTNAAKPVFAVGQVSDSAVNTIYLGGANDSNFEPSQRIVVRLNPTKGAADTINSVVIDSRGVAISDLTGTSVPTLSAALQVDSTNRGVLLPRLSSLQRDSISPLTNGLMIFNVSVGKFQGYDGTNWTNLN